MRADSPSSVPPSRIPGASNKGPYVALGAVLAAAVAGFFLWRSCAQTPPTATPTPLPPPSETVARPTLTDAPPPPPEDVPSAAPSTPSVRVANVGCGGGTCNGTSNPRLEKEVQTRAVRAKGCYQRALRQNEGIRGSMSVSLRIDGTGNVCRADVVGDTTGSADVASCVVGMFRGQRLGAAPSGGCVEMRVPLRFEATNK
jgi:hypothetical protein